MREESSTISDRARPVLPHGSAPEELVTGFKGAMRRFATGVTLINAGAN
jgi:hypothetical protein